MELMDAKDDRVSLWFSGCTGQTGPGETARLVRRAQTEAGLPPWTEMEADCFQAGDQLLILARPAPPRPHGFYFPDLETLLQAMCAFPPTESSLYSMKDGYLLVFPRPEERLPLYEFGREYPLHPDWEAHAREQGQCLLEGNAMVDLLLVYSTNGL